MLGGNEGEDDLADAPLLAEFSVGKCVYDAAEDAGVTDEAVFDGLACLERATKLVREGDVLGSNETVEDINTTDLKYLLISFYRAELHTKVMDIGQRLQHLKRASVLYKMFLMECRKRGAMSPQDEVAFEREEADKGKDRDEKILRFKREKALRDKMTQIMKRQAAAGEEHDGEEEEREYVLSLLHIAVGKSLEGSKMIGQECDILEHMQKMRPPPAAAAAIEDVRVAPGGGGRKDKGKDHSGRLVAGSTTAWDVRGRIQVQVFSFGLSMPTMSLEEFADIEVAQALERQAAQKEREAAQAAVDPDSEETADAETMKARKWDDYKDATVKGSGNTGLRSMFDCVSFEQANPGMTSDLKVPGMK